MFSQYKNCNTWRQVFTKSIPYSFFTGIMNLLKKLLRTSSKITITVADQNILEGRWLFLKTGKKTFKINFCRAYAAMKPSHLKVRKQFSWIRSDFTLNTLNHFKTNVPFPDPLKTSENQKFSDVLSGYIKDFLMCSGGIKRNIELKWVDSSK